MIELSGYHYYNDKVKDKRYARNNHTRKYLMTSFLEGSVRLPVGVDEDGNEIFEEFTAEEMGLMYPMLVADTSPTLVEIDLPESELDDEETEDEAEASRSLTNDLGGTSLEEDDTRAKKTTITVEKLEFQFQMVWQEKLLSERLKALEEKRAKGGRRSSGC